MENGADAIYPDFRATVRNVESALLAQFDLTLDHRKISVAQTSSTVAPSGAPSSERPMSVVIERSIARGEERILFRSHRIETDKPNSVRATVTVEWRGRTSKGVAEAADLPKARIEAVAEATLRAVEEAVNNGQRIPEGEEPKLFANMSPPTGYNLETMTRIGDELQTYFLPFLEHKPGQFVV